MKRYVFPTFLLLYNATQIGKIIITASGLIAMETKASTIPNTTEDSQMKYNPAKVNRADIASGEEKRAVVIIYGVIAKRSVAPAAIGGIIIRCSQKKSRQPISA